MLDETLSGSNMIVVDTFDYNSHLFQLVFDDDKYYLKSEYSPRYISKLIIKPNLWVFFKDGGYEEGVKLLKPVDLNRKKVLAMNFNIDPTIFNILVENNIISYSTAMADLYNLPVSYSRDREYHHNDYKRTKTKEKILTKLKSGIFN